MRYLTVWGAHACSVLVSAFCRNELNLLLRVEREQKFASARRPRQHATTVRSPDMTCRRSRAADSTRKRHRQRLIWRDERRLVLAPSPAGWQPALPRRAFPAGLASASGLP